MRKNKRFNRKQRKARRKDPVKPRKGPKGSEPPNPPPRNDVKGHTPYRRVNPDKSVRDKERPPPRERPQTQAVQPTWGAGVPIFHGSKDVLLELRGIYDGVLHGERKSHKHARAAYSRARQESDAMAKIFRKRSGAKVLDVGTSNRNLSRNGWLGRIHGCECGQTPEILVKNRDRRLKSEFQYQADGCNFGDLNKWCTCNAENCPALLEADYVIWTHSVYYGGPREVARLLSRCKLNSGYIVCHHFPVTQGVMFGKHPYHKYSVPYEDWMDPLLKVRPEDTEVVRVSMQVDGNSEGYEHFDVAWLSNQTQLCTDDMEGVPNGTLVWSLEQSQDETYLYYINWVGGVKPRKPVHMLSRSSILRHRKGVLDADKVTEAALVAEITGELVESVTVGDTFFSFVTGSWTYDIPKVVYMAALNANSGQSDAASLRNSMSRGKAAMSRFTKEHPGLLSPEAIVASVQLAANVAESQRVKTGLRFLKGRNSYGNVQKRAKWNQLIGDREITCSARMLRPIAFAVEWIRFSARILLILCWTALVFLYKTSARLTERVIVKYRTRSPIDMNGPGFKKLKLVILGMIHRVLWGLGHPIRYLRRWFSYHVIIPFFRNPFSHAFAVLVLILCLVIQANSQPETSTTHQGGGFSWAGWSCVLVAGVIFVLWLIEVTDRLLFIDSLDKYSNIPRESFGINSYRGKPGGTLEYTSDFPDPRVWNESLRLVKGEGHDERVTRVGSVVGGVGFTACMPMVQKNSSANIDLALSTRVFVKPPYAPAKGYVAAMGRVVDRVGTYDGFHYQDGVFITLPHEFIYDAIFGMERGVSQTQHEVSFAHYVATRPASKRKQLRAMHERLLDEGLEFKRLCFKGFMKRENILCMGTVLPFEEYRPRVIQALPPVLKAWLGPWFKSYADGLKEVFNMANWVWYSSGATASDHSAWFNYHYDELSAQVLYFISTDYSKYDVTQSPDIISREHKQYCELGLASACEPHIAVEDFLKFALRTPVSCDGKRFSVEGTRKSGDLNTSSGNSKTTAECMISFFCSRFDITFVRNNVRMVVLGDDCFMIATAAIVNALPENMGEMLCKHAARLGLNLKIRVDTEAHHGEYCSSRFWPTRSGFVFGKKPGRTLCKLGWFVSKHGPPTHYYTELFAGSIYSQLAVCHHVPFLRVYTQRCAEYLTAHNIAPRGMFDNPQRTVDGIREADCITWDAFSEMYGLTPLDEATFGENLSRHLIEFGLGAVMHSPIVEQLYRVDAEWEL